MATSVRTNPERITALEIEVKHLKESFENKVDEMKAEHSKLQATIEAQNEKLDSLLELKAKGMGAIWLASAVLGSGILGVIYMITSWMRGDF